MEQERSVRDALITEEKKSSTQQIEMDKRLQAAQKEKREIEDRAQEVSGYFFTWIYSYVYAYSAWVKLWFPVV